MSTASWAPLQRGKETVGDDLDAPLVLPLNNKVTQEHVGDSGPGLTASPSSGSLELRQLASATNRSVGRRLVVTKASRRRLQGQNMAECRDQGQLQAQAAQQHHTVRRRLEPELGGSRQGCDHLGCEGAGLGIQPAIEEGSSRPVRAKAASSAKEALRCHPRVKSVGWSSGCSGKGQGVWASWSHRGAWKPLFSSQSARNLGFGA